MKKFYSLALMTACLFAVASLNAQTVNLNTSSYTGSTSTAVSETVTSYCYSFTNNNYTVTITNSSSKAYSSGSATDSCATSSTYNTTFTGIKYSAAAQYTVALPTGLTVTSISFTGYDNYNTTDSYISEFNGTTYDATTSPYVFAQKASTSKKGYVQSYTISGLSLTNSFTFTLGAKQTVLQIVLNPTSAGITETTQATLDPNGKTSVYGIDGKLIRSNVTRSSATNGLAKGLYIVDKQKVIVSK